MADAVSNDAARHGVGLATGEDTNLMAALSDNAFLATWPTPTDV